MTNVIDLPRTIIFHHDNEPAQAFEIAMVVIVKLHYELLSHPSYITDLVPYDFFQCTNMKKWVCGNRFILNRGVITETDIYFVKIEKLYFLEELKKLDKM